MNNNENYNGYNNLYAENSVRLMKEKDLKDIFISVFNFKDDRTFSTYSNGQSTTYCNYLALKEDLRCLYNFLLNVRNGKITYLVTQNNSTRSGSKLLKNNENYSLNLSNDVYVEIRIIPEFFRVVEDYYYIHDTTTNMFEQRKSDKDSSDCKLKDAKYLKDFSVEYNNNEFLNTDYGTVIMNSLISFIWWMPKIKTLKNIEYEKFLNENEGKQERIARMMLWLRYVDVIKEISDYSKNDCKFFDFPLVKDYSKYDGNISKKSRYGETFTIWRNNAKISFNYKIDEAINLLWNSMKMLDLCESMK